MARVLRSPAVGSAAAATAPSRLSKELGGDALWRSRADGRIEVVVLREKALERYVVEDGGRPTLVDTWRATRWQRWSFRVAMAGWLLGLVAIVVAGIVDPDGSGPGGMIASGFLVGFVLFGVGGYASAQAGDIRARLKRIGEDPKAWFEPTDLRDWVPRTTDELAAVERIADEHEGLAYVREAGLHTVEVAALRSGELSRYWVSEDGRAEILETLPPPRTYVIDRVLEKLFAALFLGLFVGALALDEHKSVILGSIGAALVVVLVTGWLNDRGNEIEQRLARFGGQGAGWVEIRTRVEEEGGE